MSRWYRAYEGTVNDPKLAEAAMVAEVSRAVSVAAWHALLENAASVNNCGSYEITPRRVSIILCEPPAAVEALFAAYAEVGLIEDGVILSWKKRQFESDDSKERVARHRAKKKEEAAGNADVTACNDDVTPPETETETEETPLVPLPGGRRGKSSIPIGWTPPPISELTPKAKSLAEQWTVASYETVAEGFYCYWRRTGRMNKDWRLTWCEWVIKEHSKVMRDQKFGNAAPPAKARSWDQLSHEEKIARTKESIAFYSRINRPDDVAECRRRLEALEGKPDPKIASLVSGAARSVRAA